MARNWQLFAFLIVFAGLGFGCRRSLSTGQITGDFVRVRVGPKLKGPTIAILRKDVSVDILDTIPDNSNDPEKQNWYHVQFDGGSGYVAAEYVEVLEPNQFQIRFRQFSTRFTDVGAKLSTVVSRYGIPILPWAGLALAVISIACILLRRSTLARLMYLMNSIQKIWKRDQQMEGRATAKIIKIQQPHEPSVWRFRLLILAYILFFVSILLPAVSYNSNGEVRYNTYGAFTLFGSLLIRTIGTGLYLLLPLALWQLLDLDRDWKFLIAAVAWLCFAEAAHKPSPPPLIGSMVDTLLMIPFGRADLLVGGLLFVGISCIFVGKSRERSENVIRSIPANAGLSDERVERDVLSALTNFGYARSAAENAIRQARARYPNGDLEKLLRTSLQMLARKFL